MNLAIYVEALRQQLVAVADAGGPESRATIDRIVPGMEAAIRLVLLEALSAAADQITGELAPGTVEIRLRGSDPEFVVTSPTFDVADLPSSGGAATPSVAADEGDGGTSRLNLRLPEGLKTRIEEAARREGLSLNTWFVRTAAAAVDAPKGQARRAPSGGQSYTGWVR